MGGREEEKGTLVFSLCIHSDFVIFFVQGKGAPHFVTRETNVGTFV